MELSWEEAEETDDLEMYEVWVGGRALGEFEQPEESEVSGSILQFQVATVVRTVVRALSHAQCGRILWDIWKTYTHVEVGGNIGTRSVFTVSDQSYMLLWTFSPHNLVSILHYVGGNSYIGYT